MLDEIEKVIDNSHSDAPEFKTVNKAFRDQSKEWKRRNIGLEAWIRRQNDLAQQQRESAKDDANFAFREVVHLHRVNRTKAEELPHLSIEQQPIADMGLACAYQWAKLHAIDVKRPRAYDLTQKWSEKWTRKQFRKVRRLGVKADDRYEEKKYHAKEYRSNVIPKYRAMERGEEPPSPVDVTPPPSPYVSSLSEAEEDEADDLEIETSDRMSTSASEPIRGKSSKASSSDSMSTSESRLREARPSKPKTSDSMSTSSLESAKPGPSKLKRSGKSDSMSTSTSSESSEAGPAERSRSASRASVPRGRGAEASILGEHKRSASPMRIEESKSPSTGDTPAHRGEARPGSLKKSESAMSLDASIPPSVGGTPEPKRKEGSRKGSKTSKSESQSMDRGESYSPPDIHSRSSFPKPGGKKKTGSTQSSLKHEVTMD